MLRGKKCRLDEQFFKKKCNNCLPRQVYKYGVCYTLSIAPLIKVRGDQGVGELYINKNVIILLRSRVLLSIRTWLFLFPGRAITIKLMPEAAVSFRREAFIAKNTSYVNRPADIGV